MRRTVGLLFAVALLMPAGVLVASPAGAVTGPKCTKLSFVATFKPALPVITSKKTVKPLITTVGALTGCTGPGGSSAKTSSSTLSTTGTNCKILAGAKVGKAGAPSKSTIKWKSGKKSTATVTLTPNGKTLQSLLTSTITTGDFKGLKTKVTILATLSPGACATKPLSSLAVKSITKFS